MYVVTIDQRDSRRTADRVDELLDRLGTRPGAATYVRGFERTAGDEAQGVLADAGDVVDLTLDLARDGRWSVGVGVGSVRTPLPVSTRAGHGAAFSLAREAVTRAKSRPTGLAVDGERPRAAAHAQAALDLLAAIVLRRTARGWEAVDLAAGGVPQTQVAQRLGISKQAVSQRLQAAEWHLEPGGRAMAAHLLSEADGTVPAP